MPGPRYIRSGRGVLASPPCEPTTVSGFDLDPGIRRGGRGLGTANPSPLAGEGGPRSGADEGFLGGSAAIGTGEGGVTPHPALRATFSRKGRRTISIP
ncbi:hypothetical protein CA606_04815 [Caulobacter vibrioides]|uniref:Uncharacterized protein n=1 Tax=Caulobacter vibrioides TaxID=155892 RepID=A0A290MVT6_CAUVI|nr:hypothetical protein CA606_04815 [Caulobacter vibrioides]